MNIHGPKCHDIDSVQGYGNSEAQVMLIGIAPGREEVKNNKPFVGPAGRLLDFILQGIGYPRELCYATNVYCLLNNEPSPREYTPCRPRLDLEISIIKPKLIVLIGNIPSQAFFPEYKEPGKIRGSVIWSDKYNCYILPTYHPSAVLHGAFDLCADIVKDLDKIPDILTWPNDGTINEISYNICTNSEVVQLVLDKYSKEEIVALDVETHVGKDELGGLDVFQDRLLTVSFGTKDHALVLPAEVAQGVKWPDDLHWVYHNGMFDTQAMKRYLNIDLPICDDTMLMSYALDERSGKHDLKQLARGYCGAGFYEGEFKGNRKKNLGDADFNLLSEYNAKDVVYTARLVEILKKKLIKDDVYDLYVNLLLPAANMFKETQYRGVYVDQVRFKQLALEWLPAWIEKSDELIAYVASHGGPKEINLNSTQQLGTFIFDVLGVPILKYTKTGRAALDKEVMQELKEYHPFIKEKAKLTSLSYTISHFIMTLPNHIKLDRRAHPAANLNGTVTGRISYWEPPIQTITKDLEFSEEEQEEKDPWGTNRLRSLFAATNDDYVIVEADYKSAELYAAVAYSHDKNLIADLKSGDYHRHAAATYFKKPIDKVTSKERKDSKYVTFGRLYKRGASAMIKKELKDYTLNQAEEMMNNFDNRYRTYMNWSDGIVAQAHDEGEVRTLSGRKRRFYYSNGPDGWKIENAARNAPIQGVASDISLLSAVELHPILKNYDSYILFLVHDAIIFEVNKKYLKEVLKLINVIMAKPRYEGYLPLEIEIKYGSHWGQGKEVKFKGGEPLL